MVRTLEDIATDPIIRRSMEEEEFAALRKNPKQQGIVPARCFITVTKNLNF